MILQQKDKEGIYFINFSLMIYSLTFILCKFKSMTNKSFKIIWDHINECNLKLLPDNLRNELCKFVPVLGLEEMVKFVAYFNTNSIIYNWCVMAYNELDPKVFYILTIVPINDICIQTTLYKS